MVIPLRLLVEWVTVTPLPMVISPVAVIVDIRKVKLPETLREVTSMIVEVALKVRPEVFMVTSSPLPGTPSGLQFVGVVQLLSPALPVQLTAAALALL
jgi:hypothetical protein